MHISDWSSDVCTSDLTQSTFSIDQDNTRTCKRWSSTRSTSKVRRCNKVSNVDHRTQSYFDTRTSTKVQQSTLDSHIRRTCNLEACCSRNHESPTQDHKGRAQ